jgi:hypothetical protein
LDPEIVGLALLDMHRQLNEQRQITYLDVLSQLSESLNHVQVVANRTRAIKRATTVVTVVTVSGGLAYAFVLSTSTPTPTDNDSLRTSN